MLPLCVRVLEMRGSEVRGWGCVWCGGGEALLSMSSPASVHILIRMSTCPVHAHHCPMLVGTQRWCLLLENVRAVAMGECGNAYASTTNVLPL